MDPNYVLSLRFNIIALTLITIYFIMTRYKALRWERAAEREDERAIIAGEPLHA